MSGSGPSEPKGGAGLRILVYGDSPACNTGLGIVARHTVRALVEAGHDVICFGMNHWVPYVDPREFPYPIYAAGINPEGDVYGRAAFLRLVKKLKPDLIYSSTDFQVTAQWLQPLREFYTGPVVDYAPVDCELCEYDVKHLGMVDRLVTYTRYGREQLARFGYEADVVYLGCDTRMLKPVSAGARRKLRKKIFGADDDVFIVLAVARNQWRKDLSRTMEAFRLFRDAYAGRAMLYLHSRVRDMGGDLRYHALSVGLDIEHDVVFTPADFNEVTGIDAWKLAHIYNCADAVVSTSLGEGWGMSTTEAFACKVPFVGPRHTSFLELVGENEERGWLADVAGWQVCYGFDSHKRPVADEHGVVEKLAEIAVGRGVRDRVESAYRWVQQYTWERTGAEMRRIIEEAGDG